SHRVEDAAALLRGGHVDAARALLDALMPADGWTDPRALRLHVGQILLREGRDRRGAEILSLSHARADETPTALELSFWVRTLRARLDFCFDAQREVAIQEIGALLDQLEGQRAAQQTPVRHDGR